MTTRPIAPMTDAAGIIQFPDAPPEEMTAFDYVNFPAYPPSLAVHFGNPDTTIIISEIAAALIPTRTYEGVLYPDLLIAFDVDPAARVTRNGYLIPEQGKPPDFVLEVASETTDRRDETVKRDAYAVMGVPDTGGSTLPAVADTRRVWQATNWWTGPTSRSPFTAWTMNVAGDIATL